MRLAFGCAATILLAQVLAPPAPLCGQSEGFTRLRWWHPLAAGASVALLFAIDEPVRDYVQDHRSSALDDVGDVAKAFKEPEVFAVSSAGTIALGLISGQPAVTRTGLQILAAYGLSSSMMIASKWVFGRSRPSATPDDPIDFSVFGGGQSSSFPSGSAAVVFSLATTVADAVHHPVASVALYGGAVLNSWSRINGDRHWLSDVALGALYGITAAKLVNGHWRVFGLQPPAILVRRDGSAAVRYTVTWSLVRALAAPNG